MLRVCQLLQDGWQDVRQSEVRYDAMSNCVRAAPSSICNGMGLIACHDLPAGTLATFYPVHALGLGSTRMELEFDDGLRCQRFDGSPYRVEIWHKSLRNWGAEGMWIDADPNRQVAGWLGHLANDVADSAATLGADVTQAQLLRYYEEAAAGTNAAMVPYGHGCPPLMAVVTTRAVSEGDELLLSYGHNYWTTRGASAGLSDEAAAAAVAAIERPGEAVNAAAAAEVERSVAAQAAVEAEYAPEIGRFETIFEVAARQAVSEGVQGDVVDNRRTPAADESRDRGRGGSAPEAVNRRQRREAAKRKRRKKG